MVGKYLQPYRTALLISCGLYLAACALPATEWWKIPDSYSSDDPLKGYRKHTIDGWQCLLFGWLGEPAWLANLIALVAVALLLLRRSRGAAAFGATATAIAIAYLLAPSSKADHPVEAQVGAVLWAGSFAALTAAALIRRGGRQQARHAEPGAAADGGGR